jgi:hypothetical protein
VSDRYPVVMLDTCTLWTSDRGDCRQLATSHASAACVHEHVADFRLCDVCAMRLRDDLAPKLLCVACEHAADPHACALIVMFAS